MNWYTHIGPFLYLTNNGDIVYPDSRLPVTWHVYPKMNGLRPTLGLRPWANLQNHTGKLLRDGRVRDQSR